MTCSWIIGVHPGISHGETMAVDNSDTATLYGSSTVARRIGVTRRVLDHWVRAGAITPAQPASGTGSKVGYDAADVARLEAIAAVRDDLWTLGLTLPVGLVRRLWIALCDDQIVVLGDRSVLITVSIDEAA